MIDVALNPDGAAILTPARTITSPLHATFSSPGFSEDATLLVVSSTANVLGLAQPLAYAVIYGFYPALLLLVGGAVLMLRRVRRRGRRAGEWYCKGCNYHLAGVRDGAPCPECAGKRRVLGRSMRREVAPVLVGAVLAIALLVGPARWMAARLLAHDKPVLLTMRSATPWAESAFRRFGMVGLPKMLRHHVGWVAGYEVATGAELWTLDAQTPFLRAAPVVLHGRGDGGPAPEVVAGVGPVEVARVDMRSGAVRARVRAAELGPTTTLGGTQVTQVAVLPEGGGVLLCVANPNQPEAHVMRWDGSGGTLQEVARQANIARVLNTGPTYYHAPWIAPVAQSAGEAGAHALLFGSDLLASGRLVRMGVPQMVQRVRAGVVEASATVPVAQYAGMHASRDGTLVLVEDSGPPLLVRTTEVVASEAGKPGAMMRERWQAADGVTTLSGFAIDATGAWALVRATRPGGNDEAWVVHARTHRVAALLAMPAGETIMRGTIAPGGTAAAVVTLHNTTFEQRVRVYKGIAASTNDAGTPDAEAVTP